MFFTIALKSTRLLKVTVDGVLELRVDCLRRSPDSVVSKSNSKVALVERVLTRYRVKAYDECRQVLARDGIEFLLVYGQPDDAEAKKQDTADLAWARKIHNVYLPARFVYQPCWRAVRNSDLIIVEQANRLLINCILLAGRPFRRYRVAFNGHGYCHQKQRLGFSNRIKRVSTNLVDWWFPYTDGVASFLTAGGFPPDRITVLNNSIDTRELQQFATTISSEETASCRQQLGIDAGPVGIFCGGMYAEKEIRFLLAACVRIKQQVPGFHMIFLGDGEDSALVKRAAAAADWIHYLGATFGRDKAKYLMAADAFLLPGAVGLAILDCFAVGLPLLTTTAPTHGPEIAYLADGVNGLASEFDVDAYSGLVSKTLMDRALLRRLRTGSANSSNRYSLENMVERFCTGIKQCLASS